VASCIGWIAEFRLETCAAIQGDRRIQVDSSASIRPAIGLAAPNERKIADGAEPEKPGLAR
jgi:hypothetical protein